MDRRNGKTARRWRLVGPAGWHPVPSRPSCPAVRSSAVSGLFLLFPFNRCSDPFNVVGREASPREFKGQSRW